MRDIKLSELVYEQRSGRKAWELAMNLLGDPDSVWKGGRLLVDGQFTLERRSDAPENVEIRKNVVVQGLSREAHPEESASLLMIESGSLQVVKGGATQSGGGSVIRDLAVQSLRENNSPVMQVNAYCIIDNVTLDKGRGPGLFIQGDARGGFGNANYCKVSNVNISNCDGGGILVQGPDANCGIFDNVRVNGCGGWSIWDDSLIGNRYTGCGVDGYSHELFEGTYRAERASANVKLRDCYEEGSARKRIGPTTILTGDFLGLEGNDPDLQPAFIPFLATNGSEGGYRTSRLVSENYVPANERKLQTILSHRAGVFQAFVARDTDPSVAQNDYLGWSWNESKNAMSWLLNNSLAREWARIQWPKFVGQPDPACPPGSWNFPRGLYIGDRFVDFGSVPPTEPTDDGINRPIGSIRVNNRDGHAECTGWQKRPDESWVAF